MSPVKAALFGASLFLVAAPTLDAARAAEPAEEWRAAGKYFSWTSPLRENGGKTMQVFYLCVGDAAKRTIVMVHGFPTSSFDFKPLIDLLAADYRVCTFDFPGYGVSDKPLAPYRYTLGQDAQLIWDFVTRVVPLREFILLSHDRGDSVALNFLQLYQANASPPFRITHQVLTNANMYLPLANLTDFQKAMLNPQTSAAVVKSIDAPRFAAGMGASQYSPPLKADDPEVRALAYNFAYQDGVTVIPGTIQYLNERMNFEVGFLETLGKSTVPVTLIWGMHDMVSPVRVSDYVWASTLKPRAATASYWLVPCANHYLFHDQPTDLARLLRLALGGETPAAPQNLTTDACAPVLVDQH